MNKISWKETRSLIKADLSRRLELEGRKYTTLRALSLLIMPGALCVVLYRISEFLHQRNHRVLVRLLGDLGYLLCCCEVHVGSVIGPGLILPDRGGVGIPAFSIIGKNCTFLGPTLLTLGGIEGVDLSKDKIILGDNCIIGPGVRIMGAVELADCTQVKDNAVVIISSKKEGGMLSGMPARRRKIIAREDVVDWSPYLGEKLSKIQQR